jgi:hypothetical protein
MGRGESASNCLTTLNAISYDTNLMLIQLVARQALLTQWTIDQRKEAGINTTSPRDVLDQIRPTLRKSNNTDEKPTAKTAGSKTSETKPAKKEDCVFDVTSNNFQKIVLDSPVPVILGIYNI